MLENLEQCINNLKGRKLSCQIKALFEKKLPSVQHLNVRSTIKESLLKFISFFNNNLLKIKV